MYRAPFQEISALTLHRAHAQGEVEARAESRAATREKLIAEPAQRARPGDTSAADALQWTLDHEAAK